MHRLQNSRIDRAVSLPAVGTLLNEPAYAELVGEYGRARVVEALREQIASERSGEAEGSKGPPRARPNWRPRGRPNCGGATTQPGASFTPTPARPPCPAPRWGGSRAA